MKSDVELGYFWNLIGCNSEGNLDKEDGQSSIAASGSAQKGHKKKGSLHNWKWSCFEQNLTFGNA